MNTINTLQFCLPIIIILLVILLLIILYTDHIIFGINGVENYANFDNFGNFNDLSDDDKYLFLSTNFPFNNTQIGTRRGLSYDLRGDIPIPYTDVGPWLNSPHIPIYNKPLYLVS